MVGAVPMHVVGEVLSGGLEAFEDSRVVGPVFHGPETRLTEGIVVGDVGPVEGEFHAVGGERVTKQV